MTYAEIKRAFREVKRDTPRENLTAHIVFTEDSFAVPYSLISRTYRITSDNKAFWPRMSGYSIFADCLDKNSDQGVRLDWYMADEGVAHGWEVQDCYILERMRDAAAVPGAVRTDQEDGTVRYAFGDTHIQAHEVTDDGRLRLEPVAGSQATDGERVELPADRVYGYCALLERCINGRACA